jgi:putative phage-type endonuclease
MGAAEQLALEGTAGPYVDTGIRSDDRERWLAARRSGIGASEAAIVMGESRWKAPPRLWAEKVGRVVDEAAGEYLEWGLRHEPTILAAYASERYSGRRVVRAGTILRSTIHPWAMCTLDAWTWRPADGARPIPLEAKTAEVWKAEEWAEGPPADYAWQAQHQMLVTGAPVVSVACLLGVHRLVWCDVERDETMIRRLVRAGEDFWSHVERGSMPPGELDGDLVVRLWPRDDGNDVELDGAFVDLDQERQALLDRKRETEARLREIDDAIKAAIGPATRGVLPGGQVQFSFKAQTRREHVVKESQTRVLRRHAAKEE